MSQPVLTLLSTRLHAWLGAWVEINLNVAASLRGPSEAGRWGESVRRKWFGSQELGVAAQSLPAVKERAGS